MPARSKILIVDDHALFRDGVASLLLAWGHEVVGQASDGAEALDLFVRRREELTLVLMDLTMPVMDGREAFLRMKALAPNVPVVLTSGYNEQHVMGDFTGGDLAGFLPKPYNRFQFESVLRKALEPRT